MKPKKSNKYSTHKLAYPLKITKLSNGYGIVDSDKVIIAEGLTKENAALLIKYYNNFDESLMWLKILLEQDTYVLPRKDIPSKYFQTRILLMAHAKKFLALFGEKVIPADEPDPTEIQIDIVPATAAFKPLV